MLNIKMLGDFSISYGDKVISEQSKRSKKMWSALEYLIVHHDKNVSQDDLIELLWGDDDSGNPLGALKTQMHRLRALLSELECPQSIIVNANKSYAFNTEIDYTIDIEVFEADFKKALSTENEDEKLELLINVVDLYQGDFLSKSSYESWVVPLSTYYKSIYTKSVHLLIELLEKKERLQDVKAVCNDAIKNDPYDEFVHYHLIKALSELGEQQIAKKHYEYVDNLLYSKFGVSPSAELTELYEKSIKTDKNIETNLNVISRNLMEEQVVGGAFFCEYQIFKHLYRLEVRESRRSGISNTLCLLSIRTTKGELPTQNALVAAMGKLMDCISTSIRGSDVFSKYSVCQFVLFLHNTNHETGKMVLQRIEHNFKHKNTNKEIVLELQFKSAGDTEDDTYEI